jgi:putative membrane protein
MLYWGSGAHWWAWLVGSVFMLAFWVVIVWAIWYLVTNLTRQPEHRRAGDEAKRILDERLARGEIDAEEYTRLRELIQSPDVHASNGQTPQSAGHRR